MSHRFSFFVIRQVVTYFPKNYCKHGLRTENYFWVIVAVPKNSRLFTLSYNYLKEAAHLRSDNDMFSGVRAQEVAFLFNVRARADGPKNLRQIKTKIKKHVFK